MKRDIELPLSMKDVTLDLDVRPAVLLEMHAITKDFPGVRALDAVDFDLRAGEVHVRLGENGAGKSTLINVMAGANFSATYSVKAR